jgi:hypothetical protein
MVEFAKTHHGASILKSPPTCVLRSRVLDIDGRYGEVVTAPCAGRHPRLLPLGGDEWLKCLGPKAVRFATNPVWPSSRPTTRLLSRPELGEPHADVRVVRRVVQLLSAAHDVGDHAGRCGGIGERSVVRGAAVERVSKISRRLNQTAKGRHE